MKVFGSKRFALLAAMLASTGVIFMMSPKAHSQQAAAEGSSGELAEIIVSAQRREEHVVDVPISITAVTGKRLQDAGITDMGGLAAVVPGLHIDQASSYFQPSIRGVGTAIAGAGASSNIATYVDGVYKPNQFTGLFNFIDVDNIDVLKGPQGTLFGRNATGGAILVNTKGPSFDTQFEAKVDYGSFHTTNVAVFASTGFTDVLAGSIAAGYTHSEGWVLNTATDESANRVLDYTVRAKLLFKPNDTFSALLTLDMNEINDPSGLAQSAYNGYSDATAFFGIPTVPSGDPRRISDGQPLTNLTTGRGAALKISDDLGFATLNSISSGHWDHGAEDVTETAAPNIPNGTLPVQPCPTAAACQYLATGGDLVSTDAFWGYTEKTYSQELNLTHTGGPLDWVVGLYYYWDQNTYNPFDLAFYGPLGAGGLLDPTAKPPYPASSFINSGNEAYVNYGALAESRAIFTDLTYDLGTLTSALEKFHFTVGGRYDKDEAAAQKQQYASVAGAAMAPIARSTTFDSFVPRGVLRYAPTENSNVYFSFSKGTKAGLYNAYSLNVQDTPVAQERITAYEVGYKIATPSFQFEAAAYYYDYRDQQVVTEEGANQFYQNVPKSTISGAEFHLAQRIVGDLRFDAGLAYTHARYTEFDNAATQTYTPLNGVVNGTANVSGMPMDRTPTWTGSFGPHYDLPFFGGRADIDATYSFQTKSSFDFDYSAFQGGYGLLSLRTSWTDPSKHWTFSVIGRNILNKTYLTQVLPNGGYFGAVYGEPANVTVEAMYKY
jgi:iron complex outermembrane receptor protein